MDPKDFLLIVNALPEGYILLDADGIILTYNSKAVGLLGGVQTEYKGTNLSEYVNSSPDEIRVALNHWSRSRTPIPAALKWRQNRDNVKAGWRCHGFLLCPAEEDKKAFIVLRCTFGKTITSNFLALNSELSRQRALLKKLQASREEFQKEQEKAIVTLHSIGDAVITTDVSGSVEYLNPVAEKLTGWMSDAASGRSIIEIFNIIDEATREPIDNIVTRCINEDRIIELENHTVLISKDGNEYVIEDSAAPIRSRAGKTIGAVLVFHDTTDSRLTRYQLEYLAQHDTLTGLKNRHYFEQQIKHAIDLSSRGKHCFCLLYIDLDQFKVVNDTAGHSAGDELLTIVTSKFNKNLRQGDLIARLGGDEFGILIDSIGPDSMESIVSRYHATLTDFKFIWNDASYNVTCSVGATVIDNNTTSYAEAMRRSDIACYIAKQNGRNRYHIYRKYDDNVMASMGEAEVISDIRYALSKNKFLLFFQPMKPLSDGEVIYEVLLRMEKGEELIPPGGFIPVAERNGIMADIDLWVLEKALSISLEHFNEDNPCNLSINLSGTSLGNEDVSKKLKSFFRSYPDVCRYIMLEITETSAVGRLDSVSKLMSELRSLGVRFALDDFGTGFTSFTYLKHLPVDYVKIDGVFVRDIVDDPVDRAMVRSITQIAHSLGKTVIAEYVESQNILEELESLGVDMVQGYHIGRPSPDMSPV